jgi:dipeptidyl aminopeptidase/acylaminoacyl peptidase
MKAAMAPVVSLFAILATLAGAQSVGAVSLEDYVRADRIRALDPRLEGGRVVPIWLEDGIRFYYRSGGRDELPGTYFLVDPLTGRKRPLFNAKRVAVSLSRLMGEPIDAAKLPPFTLIEAESRIVFQLPKGKFVCDLRSVECVAADSSLSTKYRAKAVPQYAVRSPDGRWDAFIWNHNVYLREAQLASFDSGQWSMPAPESRSGNSHFGAELDANTQDFTPTGQRTGCDQGAPTGPIPLTSRNPQVQPPPAHSVALTSDGETLWSYGRVWKLGAEPATLDADRYRPTKGGFAWSPDSKKLLVRREDIRGVGVYPLYSSTSLQPIDHSYYYAAPGAAAIPQYDDYVIDIATRVVKKVDVPPTGLVLRPGGAEWANDSRGLFVLSSDRAPNEVRLSIVDPKTGAAKTLIRETSKTFVEMSQGDEDTIVAIAGEDIFWYSERDGWAHLYRYGLDGTLKNQVESGEYAVAELIRVDRKARQLYFTAYGKEPGIPYLRHLYRVNYDGSGVTLLTPESGDHTIQWTPRGDYFLDTYSNIDHPPVTLLRRRNGSNVMEVSRGSDAVLREIGWRAAEAFTVKARDGMTDLYGVLYRPSHFDPAKHYPIITNLYPGPFIGSVRKNWGFQGADNDGAYRDDGTGPTHGEGMSQSLAELGFIVIELDAMGSARRSKAMQDFFYGHVLDNGLPDQIAAITQLSQRFSWIDIDRVGIFGHSGGGYAAASGMLTHPEFFKVGVAEAGNHDFRSYGWYWGEKYQGPLQNETDQVSYEEQADYRYAANLKGQLLLIHGDMDCNNPTAQTLRLVDALIKEQKPFDMLIVPDSGHQLPSYAMKRAWDYFVEHLGIERPIRDYKPVAREF